MHHLTSDPQHDSDSDGSPSPEPTSSQSESESSPTPSESPSQDFAQATPPPPHAYPARYIRPSISSLSPSSSSSPRRTFPPPTWPRRSSPTSPRSSSKPKSKSQPNFDSEDEFSQTFAQRLHIVDSTANEDSPAAPTASLGTGTGDDQAWYESSTVTRLPRGRHPSCVVVPVPSDENLPTGIDDSETHVGSGLVGPTRTCRTSRRVQLYGGGDCTNRRRPQTTSSSSSSSPPMTGPSFGMTTGLISPPSRDPGPWARAPTKTTRSPLRPPPQPSRNRFSAYSNKSGLGPLKFNDPILAFLLLPSMDTATTNETDNSFNTNSPGTQSRRGRVTDTITATTTTTSTDRCAILRGAVDLGRGLRTFPSNSVHRREFGTGVYHPPPPTTTLDTTTSLPQDDSPGAHASSVSCSISSAFDYYSSSYYHYYSPLLASSESFASLNGGVGGIDTSGIALVVPSVY